MTADAQEHPENPREAAFVFASLGWRVVPIKPGGKHPVGLQQWQDAATTDPAVVESWWGHGGRFEGHGVGIATGPESGLFALDVDVTNGKEGIASLGAIQKECGKFPHTITSCTGSDGRHILFAWPDDFEIRNDAGHRLGPGLDVRGAGGQIVAPPSIHPSGARYRWMPGRSPFDLPLAEAPLALIERLCSVGDAVPAPIAHARGLLATPGLGERPGDRYNARTTWAEVLEADGWVRTHERQGPDGETRWTRPGKDKRDGCSATTGYKGADALKVFTSSVPWLREGETYDRLGYLAARHHAGDLSRAVAHLREEERRFSAASVAAPPAAASPEPTESPEEESLILALRVDWGTFWHEELVEKDWLIEPLVARGRGHALYAEGKAGKSFLVLQAIAAACTGRPSWAESPEPISALYLDYEMTQADLRERLETFGYGPGDDLSNLHYINAAGLGADLDSPAGGSELIRVARKLGVDLVVVDTLARAVAGPENDADTVRDFYRCTGGGLKALGIALLRLDHAGKERSRGQRGTSAKADDVDIVWELERTDNGVVLRAARSRMAWVPAETTLRYHEGDDGSAHHELVQGDWPVGVAGVAEQLESLGVPVEASVREARSMGVKARTTVLSKALQYRKSGLQRRADNDPRDLVP